MNKKQKEILEKRLRDLRWKKGYLILGIIAGVFLTLSIILAIFGIPLIILDSIWLHSVERETSDIKFKLAE